MIKWKPYATYSNLVYIFLIFIFGNIFNLSYNFVFLSFSFLFGIITILNMLLYIIKTREVTAEIRKAQYKGMCKIKGNKYSFEDPLVIVIDK